MTGLGVGPFGAVPFGSGEVGPPLGRVYSTLVPNVGRATLVGNSTGKATLTADPRGFAKLAPAAGFSTLQTD